MSYDTIRAKFRAKNASPTARREETFVQLSVARRELMVAIDHFAAKAEIHRGRLSGLDSSQWRQLVGIVDQLDAAMGVLRPHVRPELRKLADEARSRPAGPPETPYGAVPDSLPEIAALFPDLDWS
jgi:hypothetical protein